MPILASSFILYLRAVVATQAVVAQLAGKDDSTSSMQVSCAHDRVMSTVALESDALTAASVIRRQPSPGLFQEGLGLRV